MRRACRKKEGMMDYDTMEAGVGIDQAVAEAMGWKLNTVADGKRAIGWYDKKETYKWDSPFPPEFSTDMGAAWIAISYGRKEVGWTVSIGETPDKRWCVWVLLSPTTAVRGFSDSAALAICRAALKAVEARTDVGKDAG